MNRMCGCTPVIPALRMWRQDSQKVKVAFSHFLSSRLGCINRWGSETWDQRVLAPDWYPEKSEAWNLLGARANSLGGVHGDPPGCLAVNKSPDIHSPLLLEGKAAGARRTGDPGSLVRVF